jgi:hypothetical protein
LVGELGAGALAPTLADEPLTVRVRGHVGPVDGDVAAKLGKLGVQGGGHAVNAAVQHVAVGAELRGEAVAGVHGRHVGGGEPTTTARRAECSRTSATIRVHVGIAYIDLASAIPTIDRSG